MPGMFQVYTRTLSHNSEMTELYDHNKKINSGQRFSLKTNTIGWIDKQQTYPVMFFNILTQRVQPNDISETTGWGCNRILTRHAKHLKDEYRQLM